MKRILLALVILFLASGADSYSQNLQWFNSIAGKQVEFAQKIAIDSKDNVYTCGYACSDTVEIGNIKYKRLSKSAQLFLAKYNIAGDCLWSRFVGVDSVQVYSVVTDKSDNVYILGGYKGRRMEFDQNIVLTRDSAHFTNSSGFIAKYSSTGDCLWAKNIDGELRDNITDAAIDSLNNLLVTGTFCSDKLVFNDKNILSNTQYSDELRNFDGFLAKFTPNGDCLWAKHLSGTKSESIESIAVDKFNNIFISGSFNSDTLKYENQEIACVYKGFDSFFAKLSNEGKFKWLKLIKGDSTESYTNLILDKESNILLSGNYTSSKIDFANDISLSNKGKYDAYISKFDTAGKCQWASAVQGSEDEIIVSLTVDKNGEVSVMGNSFSAEAIFSKELTQKRVPYNYSYLAKYTKEGKCYSITRFPETAFFYSGDIATNSLNEISLCGEWGGNVTIGTHQTKANSYDGFVAKISYVTDVAELANEGDLLRIIPNPASNSINVISSINLSDETYFRIYNSIGELILQKPCLISRGEKSQTNIDVSNLAAGAYRVLVTTQNKTKSKAFTIVK